MIIWLKTKDYNVNYLVLKGKRSDWPMYIFFIRATLLTDAVARQQYLEDRKDKLSIGVRNQRKKGTQCKDTPITLPDTPCPKKKGKVGKNT